MDSAVQQIPLFGIQLNQDHYQEMTDRQDIDHILHDWEFDPIQINTRIIHVDDREVLQMRVDMGILQMETSGRPDGTRPHKSDTYFEFLKREAEDQSSELVLNEEQCREIDREFVQFYHRRVCWLQLKEFDRAVRDADHTLGLMDFCKKFSPDEQWTISHEQYRPFVLYHRTQAAALARLDEGDEGAEIAIEEVNNGLDQMKDLFEQYDAGDQFADDELVQRLTEFRESLRKRYEIGRTLQEQLSDAIAQEQYERAARIRDMIQKRRKKDS